MPGKRSFAWQSAAAQRMHAGLSIATPCWEHTMIAAHTLAPEDRPVAAPMRNMTIIW